MCRACKDAQEEYGRSAIFPIVTETFADLKRSHKERMLGIVKPSLALSLMLLATLVASISTSSNKEEKILMVVEGRCRGRLIRVSRSECTGLFMDPTFRFLNS